jgi:hypothetical protein
LYLIKIKLKEDFIIPTIKNSFNIIFIAQHVIVSLIILLLIETIIYSHYNTIILSIIFNISYGISLSLLFMLLKSFLKWYNLSKFSTMLIYAISSGVLFINTFLCIVLIDSSIYNLPIFVYPHYNSSYSPFSLFNNLLSEINNLFNIFTIISFISWWIATIFLIKQYFTKENKYKYWIIFTVPLIYFIIQFIPFTISFIPIDMIYYYSLIFTFSKPLGGILFGSIFWFIVKKFEKNNTIKKYLTIAGVGLTLIFITNQSLLVLALPFPPFGMASISILSIGNILFLYGISLCAANMAQDAQLRKYIERVTKREFNSNSFLYELSQAETLDRLDSKVSTISKKYKEELDNSFNFNNSLVKDDNIKDYIKEIVIELQSQSFKIKQNKDTDNKERV